LITLQHPLYTSESGNWEKYRLTYAGGREFIRAYLKQYSAREENADFIERREVTYCPNFAGQAINEIKNALFSRMPDVKRVNKSTTYKQALLGNLGGIDYFGGSIDNFVGVELLPELLPMGRVGVYVDMPEQVPPTLRGSNKIHPYYYVYPIEDILTWTSGEPNSGFEYLKLLLRDNYYTKDPDYGLTNGSETRYRLLEQKDGYVQLTFLEENETVISTHRLEIPKIPFVSFELQYSLLKDVCDYQVALLNLESTDINFARKANFPVYTEQSNYITAMTNLKPAGTESYDSDGNPVEMQDAAASTQKIALGAGDGRRYYKGLDRPGFIFPSPEPLKVSMEKENQIKRDIRLLVHLATAGLGNKSVSAESKQFDKQSLESGLGYIALILEEGERKLTSYWNNYEGVKDDPVIAYPRHFNLRTDVERREEANELSELSHSIPSQTFQREMMKRVVNILIGGQVRAEMLDTINKEIDSAQSLTSDPATIINDLEAGLVTSELASIIRGYPEGEAEKAQEEKAERVSLISQSQGGLGGDARGVPDLQTDEEDSSAEKNGKPKRGADKDTRAKMK
jgi:hypothetical protein